MPEPKVGQNRKDYMETCVPKLIKEGKNPDQAVAVCSSMWEAKASDELEVSSEQSIEFTSEVTDTGFKEVLQEENIFPDMTFTQVFSMLKCEPGKRYEIEISVEEV